MLKLMATHRNNLLTTALAVMLVMASCQRGTVMHEYRNTPAGGWDQSDMLVYPLDTVKEAGEYNVDIGVRTTNMFPYKKLWLVVESELVNPDTTFADTLMCDFNEEGGVSARRGLNAYQFDFRLRTITLREGQSGKLVVHHIMRREILPGVSDVGVRLYR